MIDSGEIAMTSASGISSVRSEETVLTQGNLADGPVHGPPSQGLTLAGLMVGSSMDSFETLANPNEVKL